MGPRKLGKPWKVLGRGGIGPRELQSSDWRLWAEGMGGQGAVSRAHSEAPGVAWVTQECGSCRGGTEVLGDATPPRGDWEGLADETGDRDAEKEAEEPQDSFLT